MLTFSYQVNDIELFTDFFTILIFLVFRTWIFQCSSTFGTRCISESQTFHWNIRETSVTFSKWNGTKFGSFNNTFVLNFIMVICIIQLYRWNEAKNLIYIDLLERSKISLKFKYCAPKYCKPKPSHILPEVCPKLGLYKLFLPWELNLFGAGVG